MAALTKTSKRSTLSAGVLAYRKGARGLEVLLVHPGGPFWRKKDDGAWSIPKGEIDAAEDPEQAARREFAEELGTSASIGRLQALGEVRSEEGNASSHSPERAILTRRHWRAIRSISNGRPEAVGDRTFPKSTARNGSISSSHERRCSPGKWSFSIVFWR
jgi:8-oxo-dGTP pyrophosphatase MutT (NUDIX family)